VFKNQTIVSFVEMCIHEYVHTQQKGGSNIVPDTLTFSIGEGACDFITELVIGRPRETNYIKYGDECYGKG
jgi:hypothetical protein